MEFQLNSCCKRAFKKARESSGTVFRQPVQKIYWEKERISRREYKFLMIVFQIIDGISHGSEEFVQQEINRK